MYAQIILQDAVDNLLVGSTTWNRIGLREQLKEMEMETRRRKAATKRNEYLERLNADW